jgi:uracil-DNA glycosylase
MKVEFTFPFGEKVHPVQQTDRTPKKVFVLGVYASAVHARWLSSTGTTIVQALAVASEPYIFWKGDDAEIILQRISVPKKVGSLEPASSMYNGPSGKNLDDSYLNPLGCERKDAWLCDLLPETRLNDGQRKALRKYEKFREEFSLPEVTIPEVPRQFADERRQAEIVKEIQAANPKLIILLGDQPIRWFLSSFTAKEKLSDFVKPDSPYGSVHPSTIFGKVYSVLPLVHPRQSGALGMHSSDWNDVHRTWTKVGAQEIVKRYLID